MAALRCITHAKFTTTRNFNEVTHTKFILSSALKSPVQAKFNTRVSLKEITHGKFFILFLYAYQLVNIGHTTFRIGNAPTVPDVIKGVDGSAVFIQLIG